MADVEHTVKIFPIDENLRNNVEALVGEGWNVVPGVAPVAIYHLVREKRPITGAAGKMRIDDTKIMIIPANSGLKQ